VREGTFFTALFAVCLVISYPINFPDGKPKGGTEFFADKAAYYVYLPATFIYHWDIKKFPEKIDEQTRGFTLHYKSDRLIIKTTYGVALMLTPFFIPAHLIAKTFNLEPDGFSVFYQKMMTIPGIFYLVIGLFFLRRFLENYLAGKITYIAVTLVFAGTNLFFYSVDEGLMSHVYSFFLFSTSLFLLKIFLDGNKKSFPVFLWLSVTLSLAILLRPTNIIFLSLLVFLDVQSLKEAGARAIFFLKPRYSLSFLLLLFLLFLPQMFYWRYLSGSYLYNSYPGEGFTNLGHPMILGLWFAPLNGFFLYTPMALFFIAGVIFMIIKKIPNGIFILLLFLILSYLFASWLTWFFGGSFGMRPFVEFYSIFALPFGYSLEWVLKRKNLFIRSLFILSIGAFTWYNLKLTYHYNCFPGSVWSWDDYRIYLSDAGVQHFSKKTYTFINDFENNTLPDDIPRVNTIVHSPTLSSYADTTMEFICKYSRRLDEILDHKPRSAAAGIWIYPDRTSKTGALLICSIIDQDNKTLFYQKLNIDTCITKTREWVKAEKTFYFPEWIVPSSKVTFYIWNLKRKHFFIDDMTIKFE